MSHQNNIYQQKYLKYKAKYLQYKAQKGGTIDISKHRCATLLNPVFTSSDRTQIIKDKSFISESSYKLFKDSIIDERMIVSHQEN
jgi:hypothetical protein